MEPLSTYERDTMGMVNPGIKIVVFNKKITSDLAYPHVGLLDPHKKPYQPNNYVT